MAARPERAALTGRLHADPKRNLAELLIDLEEDRRLALDFAQERANDSLVGLASCGGRACQVDRCS
jgi:hypothetical protein